MPYSLKREKFLDTREKQNRWAIHIVLVLVGMLIMLFATKWGIGTSPDSIVYVSVARSLLSGNGLATYDKIPMTHYPPVYPVLLAMTGFVGWDPLDGARWVHSFLFGANVLLAGLAVDSCFHRPNRVWVFGPILALSSISLFEIHSMAWSEPSFILFGLIGVFLLALYLENDRKLFLIASSIAIDLAFLTRYSGVTWVITGVVGILLLHRGRHYKRRIVDTVIFGTISCIPMTLWIVRNLSVAGTVTTSSRPIGFHPIGLSHIREVLSTVSVWLLPGQVPRSIRGCFLVAVGLWTAVSGKSMHQKEKRGPGNIVIEPALGMPHLPALLLIFLIVYGWFLAFFISFFDFDLPLDGRMLSPAYIPGLVLFLYTQHLLLVSAKEMRNIRFLVFIVCSCLSAFFLARGAIWLVGANKDGLGYASRTWESSQVVGRVKALPADVHIFSNGPDAVYILTGRPASLIPPKVFPLARQIDRKYPSQLARMMEQVDKNSGVIVYFNAIGWRWYLPDADELKDKFGLRILFQGSDGIIYSTGIGARQWDSEGTPK